MSEAEALKILRACKELVEKLNSAGINAPLTSEELALLQNFSNMLAIYGKMQELKFLADRAGVRIHELGTLRFRATIEAERKRGLATCPRCGCDKYEEPHHYLCQDSAGFLVFSNISDDDMRAIIDRVRAVENPAKNSVEGILGTSADISKKPLPEAGQSDTPKKLLLKRLPQIQAAS